MSPEDVTKLPKWAQDRIRQAERRLAETIAERDSLIATLSPSDTAVVEHFTDAQAVPQRRERWLPFGSTVVFLLDPDDRRSEVQVSVLARNGQRVVEVMGSDAIAVLPGACNSVHIVRPARDPGEGGR